jgi:hypothetical protein
MVFDQAMWFPNIDAVFLCNFHLTSHSGVVAVQALTVMETILLGAHDNLRC